MNGVTEILKKYAYIALDIKKSGAFICSRFFSFLRTGIKNAGAVPGVIFLQAYEFLFMYHYALKIISTIVPFTIIRRQ